MTILLTDDDTLTYIHTVAVSPGAVH